jgi:Polyketide cyclase / dehydrase and lipid transport
MWTRTYTMVTKAATREQMWRLFADVNNWHKWDKEIEYAKMQGNFEAGNHFLLKPKGGPEVKIKLVETVKNSKFVDQTVFPLAVMQGAHIFEDTPEGLRVTTTITMRGLLGALWVKLVAQKLVDGLPAEMEVQANYASQL